MMSDPPGKHMFCIVPCTSVSLEKKILSDNLSLVMHGGRVPTRLFHNNLGSYNWQNRSLRDSHLQRVPEISHKL